MNALRKPFVPLHSWIACEKILQKQVKNPRAFANAKSVLLAELRSRACLLLTDIRNHIELEISADDVAEQLSNCLYALTKTSRATIESMTQQGEFNLAGVSRFSP